MCWSSTRVSPVLTVPVVSPCASTSPSRSIPPLPPPDPFSPQHPDTQRPSLCFVVVVVWLNSAGTHNQQSTIQSIHKRRQRHTNTLYALWDRKRERKQTNDGHCDIICVERRTSRTRSFPFFFLWPFVRSCCSFVWDEKTFGCFFSNRLRERKFTRLRPSLQVGWYVGTLVRAHSTTAHCRRFYAGPDHLQRIETITHIGVPEE